MNNNINIYKTRDLAESAALLINNQKLIHFERIGKICWFHFEDKTTCEALSKEYFFGNLQVNAREYHEAVTRLKNRIFAGN